MKHSHDRQKVKQRIKITRRQRKQRGWSRRRFLLVGLTAAGTVVSVFAARPIMWVGQYVQASLEPHRDFSVQGDTPLRERAAAKGLLYGGSVHQRYLTEDVPFTQQFIRECNVLVPETQMKWFRIHPDVDRYDFSGADWLVNFAQQHKMRVRGHTLVWHHSVPTWLKQTLTRRNAEQIMVDHIQTVMKRYRGKIHSWDVVNEALDPNLRRSDGLRETLWLQSLGDSYLDIAYRAAAEADPDTMLVYNDFGLEDNSFRQSGKRQALLNLLKRWRDRNVPVHAVGIQAHWRAWENFFDPQQFRNFLKEIAAMDYKILITEFDVDDFSLPTNAQFRDRVIASLYEDFFSVVLQEPAVCGVLTWGLSDRYTWLLTEGRRGRKVTPRPLPLDDQLGRKLAWNALARSFDQTFKR